MQLMTLLMFAMLNALVLLQGDMSDNFNSLVVVKDLSLILSYTTHCLHFYSCVLTCPQFIYMSYYSSTLLYARLQFYVQVLIVKDLIGFVNISVDTNCVGLIWMFIIAAFDDVMFICSGIRTIRIMNFIFAIWNAVCAIGIPRLGCICNIYKIL